MLYGSSSFVFSFRRRIICTVCIPRLYFARVYGCRTLKSSLFALIHSLFALANAGSTLVVNSGSTSIFSKETHNSLKGRYGAATSSKQTRINIYILILNRTQLRAGNTRKQGFATVVYNANKDIPSMIIIHIIRWRIVVSPEPNPTGQK